MHPVLGPLELPQGFECEHCSYRIVLPFPTPKSIAGRPDWWPNERDWLYLACPDCKQISAYIGFRSAAPLASQKKAHADELLWRISFRCAVEGCNTPVQFHVLAESTVTETTERELRAKLASGYWKGVSPCGHPIAITENQKLVFDLIHEGRLQGYNPNHRMWNNFGSQT
jgi:hypothetical protein